MHFWNSPSQKLQWLSAALLLDATGACFSERLLPSPLFVLAREQLPASLCLNGSLKVSGWLRPVSLKEDGRFQAFESDRWFAISRSQLRHAKQTIKELMWDRRRRKDRPLFVDLLTAAGYLLSLSISQLFPSSPSFSFAVSCSPFSPLYKRWLFVEGSQPPMFAWHRDAMFTLLVCSPPCCHRLSFPAWLLLSNASDVLFVKRKRSFWYHPSSSSFCTLTFNKIWESHFRDFGQQTHPKRKYICLILTNSCLKSNFCENAT